LHCLLYGLCCYSAGADQSVTNSLCHDQDQDQSGTGRRPGPGLYNCSTIETSPVVSPRLATIHVLHRVPDWSFAWHSHRYSANFCPLSWRIQIGSRLQQYSNWITSLSKIDPQPAQLNNVDLLGLVALSTQLAYSNQQPFTAVFRLDSQPI
jgi:hypothetical protein